MAPPPPGFTRREFLTVTAAGAAAATVPLGCGSDAAPPAAGYFTAGERTAIATLADYVLPPDATPGGAALGTVAYLEQLLTALDATPPRIYAGGPFSSRQPIPDATGAPTAQHPENGFAQFIAPDRVRAAGWRLRLYGSAGVPGGGPNDAVTGPVAGLRDTMKSGLAEAARLAAGPIDKLSPTEIASLWRRLPPDFTDAFLPLVMEAALAAPEYGGNARLAGWQMVHLDGDMQPFGYSHFDQTSGTYKESMLLPVSMADPGTDPDPIDDQTWQMIDGLTRTLAGRKFS
jgi:hypothetical protein